MRDPNHDDRTKLVQQWQADAASLRAMVIDMQNEINDLHKAGAPPGHIQLRQEMITQYETTIFKLQTLIKDND